MKRTINILVFVFISCGLYAQGRVKENILRAIVKIEIPIKNSNTLTGTGFIISQPIANSNYRQFFLVTNKHIVGDWNIADGNILNYYQELDIILYTKGTINKNRFTKIPISIIDISGRPVSKIKTHSNPTVDIAMIDITKEVNSTEDIDLVSFDISYLVPFSDIYKKTYTGIGDQVFAIGYPAGITSKLSNLPIAKSGYISSMPGEEFQVETNCLNRLKKQQTVNIGGKIIIIDGLIVGGNSGSPVVIPSEIKFKLDEKTSNLQNTNKESENLVLGIVSSSIGNSGVNVVFSSDYILELINQMDKATLILNK